MTYLQNNTIEIEVVTVKSPELELLERDHAADTSELDYRSELKGPYLKYVNMVYRDVLQRKPKITAAQDWVNQLVGGASLSTFVSCLFHSQERRELQIKEIYAKYLRRSPGEEGLSFWTGLLANGKTIEEITAAFLSSQEYETRAGGSHGSWVRALFPDILGRRPSDVEADCWISLLNSHSATKLAIAYDFLTNNEYRITLIDSWYGKYLRRQPDAQTLHFAIDALKEGKTQEVLQTQILSSKEYFGCSLTRTE